MLTVLIPELRLIIYTFIIHHHHLNNSDYLVNAYCVPGTELGTIQTLSPLLFTPIPRGS